MPSRLQRVMPKTVLLAPVLFLFASAAYGQRLPQTVKPEHYTLKLTPDLQTATFTGQESIDLVVKEPTDAITLNAAEIKFGTVTGTVGSKVLSATVSEDQEKQQATLHFDQQLPAGELKLDISFTGILNNELRGFYLSKTAKRNYAVTQFESTDARRAFPCFDEPALKATFSVSLIVDTKDTAISNTNILRDEPTADKSGKHEITFAKTPRMSTYLVAFLVGDFQCLSGSSDGVPIRACATPDQVQYGAYALSAAEYVLHYYDTYFGIKYPMPKLDMIAIPDFEAGAMENFGAITYRETDLLLDPKRTSVDAQRNVGLVVAHEMAHQWFGDMVTMQWWDNIWLNEGFASWMENKPIAAWKPEFNIPQEVAADNQGTLNLDAQRVTRTIRATADTPGEINEMFDGISYGKAGAMLLMVESYLGEETFRQGVHEYLAAHMYGNATAEDFWSAQTEVSHKPIDKIMNSLVSQPGVPLLTIDSPHDLSVPITQSRFFLNAKNKQDKPQTWTLPVCFKAGASNNSKTTCDLLSAPKQSLRVAAGLDLFANAGGKGYYRTSYSSGLYDQVQKLVETGLTPEERISFLGDQWALTQAGKGSVTAYLNLLGKLDQDSSAEVLKSAADSLTAIRRKIASNAKDRAVLAAWVRSHFVESYRALGDAKPNDAPGKRELRAELLTLVAGLGEDQAAIAQAKTITEQNIAESLNSESASGGHTTHDGEVDQTLAKAALDIAAQHGDAALFNELQKAAESSINPQFRSASLRSLAHFRDPALEKRALDYAVSNKVRNQDASALLSIELRDEDTQDRAWQYVQDNWDKVLAQLTTFGGGAIVSVTGNFCSADRVEQVSTFFGTHKVVAAERALIKAKDQINDCIDLRTSQATNFNDWLQNQ